MVLAAAAAERLGGDPPWLMVVGGSGAAKTQTVAPLTGAGAHVISTINGEAALLSGTSKRDRAKDATGGLLRQIGPRGLLVVKDFTSVLSMNRDTRALVLAALREIYDGRWSRNVGTDGGQTLTWHGRLVVIGAVTTRGIPPIRSCPPWATGSCWCECHLGSIAWPRGNRPWRTSTTRR